MHILFYLAAQIPIVSSSYFPMEVVFHCSFSITDIGGRIMAPKEIHPPTPRTCEYTTFHCRRDFVSLIKLRILRWGDDPELSGWVQYHHNTVFNLKNP